MIIKKSFILMNNQTFSQIKKSLITVMVYTNVIFDYKNKIINKVGKKGKFPNCYSIYFSNVNLMIFNKCIKVSGCKELYQVEKIMEDFFKNPPIKFELLPNEDEIKITYDVVMTNYDFNLGITIDREQLYKILNEKEYDEYVDVYYYEPSSQNYILIKMKNKITIICYRTGACKMISRYDKYSELSYNIFIKIISSLKN